MPRILSVSEKTRLRITRDDTLAASGFSVISPRTPKEAPLLVRQKPVDAVVICDSVDAEDRKEIIAAIRRSCHCPILFVYVHPESAEEPLADMCVDVTDGNAALVRTLEDLLSSNKIA